MNRKAKWLIIVAAACAVVVPVLLGIVAMQTQRTHAQQSTGEKFMSIREPAVAGLFYPKEQSALSRMLDELLAAAKPEPVDGALRGLVSPHAGYPYSGPTAAIGYKLLAGSDIQTVVVLAPSHYAAFRGAFIPDIDGYQTPLGIVKVSEKAATLAKLSPFTRQPHARVYRPQWWQQSSRPAPPPGEDTPDTWEHSGEVQVPFLQKVLKDFRILPVVVGDADPEEMAQALSRVIDDRTLVVASSDLSHYHPYEKAKQLDNRCVAAICALDIEQQKKQEACGNTPILVLMHLARQNGWKTKLLDYRNSGDTAGDKSGVVGYAAIAFYGPAAHGQQAQTYSKEERKLLLELARKSLKEVVTKGKLPEVDAGALPKKLSEPKGCFVTLTKGGHLRGCIGHIFPQQPLYRAVMENAQSSATRDPRFLPVRPDELDKIEIEVSVLTVPQPLQFSSPEDLLNKLQPHKDGVVLQIGTAGATYLPQVWEQIPDKVEFLNSLSQKAGCAPDAWRKPGTTVLIYHAEAFKESDK